MLFTFSADGLIDTMRAEARGRTVNGNIVPTPWHGHFWRCERQHGMLIRLDGEMT